MSVFVGSAVFDADVQGINVGWAEFDTQAGSGNIFVGWAEFDVAASQSASAPALDFTRGGGGGGSRTIFGRGSLYYNHVEKKYNVPVSNVDESEEEEILMQILMEVARYELV